MILSLVPVLVAAAVVPGASEAAHALAAGRPAQAREMIARAVANGAAGLEVDRLLADLALTEGRWQEALVRYRALIARYPSPSLYEKAGLAALQADEIAEAVRLLDRAVVDSGASAKAWNARGVAADRLREWTIAERAYDKALRLAPEEASAWNNRGWSLMLRGRWAEAVGPLERARALAPAEARIAANLDLARSAVEAELPRRRAGESGAAFAARLNDAGVVAGLQGDTARAAAAFAQALDASERWFLPAATNLAALETMDAPQGSGSRSAVRTDRGASTNRK
jgi:tetratricopeptide (TPR) repeat protein